MTTSTKLCETCLEPFQTSRSHARFCSSTCRMRAHRAGDRIEPTIELHGVEFVFDSLVEAIQYLVREVERAGVLDAGLKAKGDRALRIAAVLDRDPSKAALHGQLARLEDDLRSALPVKDRSQEEYFQLLARLRATYEDPEATDE